MSANNLVTYCGVYCGYCGRWHENAVIARLATELAELVDLHGYQHWMPTSVREFDYGEFRKALGFFSKKDSWLICYKGCTYGDGRPNCEIRDCCRERGLDLCFECEEFPCDTVKDNKRMVESAREYKKIGKEERLHQQVKKAREGYELHTEKFYPQELSNSKSKK
jgi:hypothetical protein